MNVILLAGKEQKEEFLPGDAEIEARVTWVDNLSAVEREKDIDACIDLQFDQTATRMERLRSLGPKIVIVNSVTTVVTHLGNNVVRINGWNTFLNRPTIEASGPDHLHATAEAVLAALHKTIEWVPDVAGFISSRVVASIINEAYFALQEDVSSKEEIDIAMKLGTNYPHGPFEWSIKIGLKNVHDLLKVLSAGDEKYEPAALLIKEAFA